MFSPSISIAESTASFIQTVRKISPDIKISLIKKAYKFSWVAHKDQLRKSGEPFLAHPVAVALILTEQNLDPVTIASGLLHDVLEDTDTSYETLQENFGGEVAMLVDGVTKIDSLHAKSQEQRQVETYRKMLLSMARDLRVILIKFADRLHNLRTLNYLEPDRIKAIATETIDIYAPLANRLGMARIKWEMEDLAFKYLNPKEYKRIVERIVESRHEREKVIDSFGVPLRAHLEKEKIDATVIGRPKHFYSIYRKMVQRNKPFEEIYDLLATRVITNSVQDCYFTLGLIHSMWKPIQDRFKDYIGTPKSNGYKSLHTTVMGPEGRIIEIQIRTWEMNQTAEDGIAAHWLYKDENKKNLSKDDKALTWLKNLIEWQKELTDSTEFYEFFKIDLFHAEIFVFTPKGDLISLPKGATVLDFAFAVHTDFGLHCIGARIDGNIEQINQPLKSGSTIEILHLISKNPSLDWLRDVKTPKARSAIKRWLRSASRQESIEIGKKIVLTNINNLHLSLPFNVHASALLDYFNLDSEENLFEQVGKGDIPISRIIKYFNEKKLQKQISSGVFRIVDTLTGHNSRILVGGSEDIMVRYARCCNPLPGDAIIGFITKGRGISVHRKDCQNSKIFSKDDDRSILVQWEGDNQDKRKYEIFLEITGYNRKGFLHDVTAVFYEYDANVVKGTLNSDNQKIHNYFQIEISNKNRLKQILRKLMKLKGVETVIRARDTSNFIFEEAKK